MKRFAAGDHLLVKVKGRPYTHHGIYLGNGSVMHYSKSDGDDMPSVKCATLTDFAGRGRILVVQYPKDFCLRPDDVVRRASWCRGRRAYRLFHENCEHFATWCKTGNAISFQVQQFEQLMKSAVFVGVAVFVLPALFENSGRRRR